MKHPLDMRKIKYALRAPSFRIEFGPGTILTPAPPFKGEKSKGSGLGDLSAVFPNFEVSTAIFADPKISGEPKVGRNKTRKVSATDRALETIFLLLLTWMLMLFDG